MGGTCLRNKEMNMEGGNKMCIDRISVFLVRIHQYHKVIIIIVCVLGNEGSQATDMMSWSEGTFKGHSLTGCGRGSFVAVHIRALKRNLQELPKLFKQILFKARAKREPDKYLIHVFLIPSMRHKHHQLPFASWKTLQT